jgi:hypothetical protein
VPAEPTAPQQIRVLGVLRQAGDSWVCLREFGSDAYTARNRIVELKGAGYLIGTQRCRRHEHEGTVVEYRLFKEEPAAPTSPNTLPPAVESAGSKRGGSGQIDGAGAGHAPTPTLELFPGPWPLRPGHSR